MCISVTIVATKVQHYIFWVCACSLSYPACKAHESYYHCSLSGINIFYLHYLINSMFFLVGGGSYQTENVCFDYSTTLSEISLILKRIQWHTNINIHWFSYKVLLFLSDLNQIWIFLTDFQKNNQISWKSIQKELICSMQMDKQTNMIKLTVTSHNFSMHLKTDWPTNYLYGAESFFRN